MRQGTQQKEPTEGSTGSQRRNAEQNGEEDGEEDGEVIADLIIE